GGGGRERHCGPLRIRRLSTGDLRRSERRVEALQTGGSNQGDEAHGVAGSGADRLSCERAKPARCVPVYAMAANLARSGSPPDRGQGYERKRGAVRGQGSDATRRLE